MGRIDWPALLCAVAFVLAWVSFIAYGLTH